MYWRDSRLIVEMSSSAWQGVNCHSLPKVSLFATFKTYDGNTELNEWSFGSFISQRSVLMFKSFCFLYFFFFSVSWKHHRRVLQKIYLPRARMWSIHPRCQSVVVDFQSFIWDSNKKAKYHFPTPPPTKWTYSEFVEYVSEDIPNLERLTATNESSKMHVKKSYN